MMKSVPFLCYAIIFLLLIPGGGISEAIRFHSSEGIDFDMDIEALELWLLENMQIDEDIRVHTEDTYSHLICQGVLPFGPFTVDYFGAGYLDGKLLDYSMSVEEANMLGIPLSAPDFAAQYTYALNSFIALYQFLLEEYGEVDMVVLRQDEDRRMFFENQELGFEEIDRFLSEGDSVSIRIRIDNIILWYSQSKQVFEGQDTLALITNLQFYGPATRTNLDELILL